MPTERQQRTRRLTAVREILESEGLGSQAAVVSALAARGIRATQSSVSRDLRALRVAKVGGAYVLPGSPNARKLDGVPTELVVSLRMAGPHLLVLQTEIGGASRVAFGLDRAGWPEVAGTIAGDDTVFVATTGARGQQAVRMRLEAAIGAEVDDG